MKIDAFIIAWNEAEIIQMTINHYREVWGAAITLFDNYSDDGTDKIAEAMGCNIIKYGTPGVLDDETYLQIKNNCWKESKADWVIVCDADEILMPSFRINDDGGIRIRTIKDISSALENTFCTIIKPTGWDVYSDSMPRDTFSEITTGYEYDNYAKCIMFRPDQIKEINYRPGAHKCDPVGNVIYTRKEDFILMHYRCIGGIERKLARNRAYQPRLSKTNLKKGYGGHYLYKESEVRQEWAQNVAKCIPLW
jgi:glycosyltransferase involved in cell wall biosynthesis